MKAPGKVDGEGFKLFLERELKDKKVLLLGYGREGRSSYRILKNIPGIREIVIADRDPKALSDNPQGVDIHSGEDYLSGIGPFDLILRSPGIPDSAFADLISSGRLSSQTDLFLAYFSSICIGVTGTKGKSTTSVLIRDMLQQSGVHCLLAGNIGLPPFEAAAEVKGQETRVVLELSAHQLQNIRKGPKTAVLLNLYEEHLDHFSSREAYFHAKWEIGLKQDVLSSIILNASDANTLNSPELSMIVSEKYFFNQAKELSSTQKTGQLDPDLTLDFSSTFAFPGQHQQINAQAAALASFLNGGTQQGIQKAIDEFSGLPHRLEYLGDHHGVHYYNDAIATIPEAVIAAMRSLPKVDFLLLGGYDRGVDYSALAEFLVGGHECMICCSGPAGKRIGELLHGSGYRGKLEIFERFAEILAYVKSHSSAGDVVLLSPAAPSYDEFPNFTVKGDLYKKETGKP